MIPQSDIDRARALAIADVAALCGATFGRGQGGLRRAGREWNGPCPACGGDDRFWLDEGKNSWLCRKSGTQGGTIELIQHRHQCGFAEAVTMLAGGNAPQMAAARTPSADETARYREEARKRAHAIWKRGRSVAPDAGGHLVANYFARRHIPFPDWPLTHLREIDQLRYAHWNRDRQAWETIHEGPAMLAAITAADGHFIGVHRTWLDPRNRSGKAVIADPATGEILNAKKVEGSQRGGRILLKHGAGPAALGEGIETTLSWPHAGSDLAHRYGGGAGLALVCGINKDNMSGRATASVPHPSLTTTDVLGRRRRVKVAGPEPDFTDADCLMLTTVSGPVILLGDSDSDGFTTEAAMVRAHRRYKHAGQTCLIDWAPGGCDFNDALRDGCETTEGKPGRAPVPMDRHAGAPAAREAENGAAA